MNWLDDLIAFQVHFIEGQEIATANALLSHYSLAVNDIYAQLATIDPESFKAVHLMAIKAQLSGTIQVMEDRINRSLTNSIRDTFFATPAIEIKILQRLEERFGSDEVAQRLEALSPAINTHALIPLLVDHTETIGAMGKEMLRDVTRALAYSVTQGESVQDMTHRLREIIPPDVLSEEPGTRKYTSHLNMISRMETRRAHSIATTEIHNEINQEDEELDLWQMVHDSVNRSHKTRNHYLSWALSGTIRNLNKNEPFRVPVSLAERERANYIQITRRKVKEGSGIVWRKSGNAYQGRTLPAHFVDRGALLPHRPSWNMGIETKYHPA